MQSEKGAKLMAIAKKYDKCHYINGAYGAIAGYEDSGSPHRPGGVKLVKSHSRLNPELNSKDKKENLAVLAAEMTVNTYCVCAGSWRTVEGGRWTDPNAWDLNNYLSNLKSTSILNTWEPYFGKFTPRRAFGPGQSGEIYWGESCVGIRHFDCIGFINYCLWELTGIIYSFEISQWRENPMMTGAKVYSLPNSSIKPEDGDILIRTSPHNHIAFVGKDRQVIQAADTDRGVTVSAMGAFNPGEWSHIARLP